MTELVEKISVTVTLNHDHVDSKVYFGSTDLRQALKDIWPKLLPWVEGPKGKATFAFGGITVEWTYLGLEEQVGEGDN